ncbi:UNVERIFIED_CONTAM: hypothetical protein H355_006325, partial [Colinus virginianus]
TSMKEKLYQGITLVVDRYAFSGVAFTSAKETFSVGEKWVGTEAFQLRTSMKEKLYQGITLVVDRYAFSGVAFTSAKELPFSPLFSFLVFFYSLHTGFLCLGQNFCLDWCKQPDAGLPKPDLILFLQLSPEEAAARGNFGRERYENGPFQEKVLQSFCNLMKEKTLNWKIMDASKSIEDLHREIKSVAEKTVQEVKDKPLGELWK